MPSAPEASKPFREKDFYLEEFRGRTLALALAAPRVELDVPALEELNAVLDELQAASIRVILLGEDGALLSELTGAAPLPTQGAGWVGAVWRRLRERARVAIEPGRDEPLASIARRVSLELGLAKLVWLGADAVLVGDDGRRISLVDLTILQQLIEAVGKGNWLPGSERIALLDEFRVMIAKGLPSISACVPGRLADELFTYEGSGTFYSRESYLAVRRLVLDEFETAAHLIERGVAEGYLLPRSGDQLDVTLANSFGAFLEGRYLAGICAPLHYPADRAAEVACLYTLTRYLGEGVGGHLVGHALDRARNRGDHYVFACTTSERVAAFFVRCGFRVASGAELPEEKWKHYQPERRHSVRCLRIDL